MIYENPDSKKVKCFKTFLTTSGAEILTTTNEYEVLRFRGNEIGIVYQNKAGRITSLNDEARKAWECFENKKKYEVIETKYRIKKPIVFRTILKRDGDKCFYCGLIMKDGDETLEHLFSINQGGTNHVANLALSHRECNLLAGHLPVVEKVKLRDKLTKENENARR